jgi:RNA polymerase sigma factor (TIGR02999 family)
VNPVAHSSSNIVSELLSKWNAGEQDAMHALVPVVYRELRHLAHQYLRRERPNHTLQSTALVHEAYLRLQRQSAPHFENRAHFFAISAQLMRQILVEHARGKRAAKRNGGYKMPLDGAIDLLNNQKRVDLIALDDALRELSRLDPQQSRIVELRFFAGLTIEETARVLGISAPTVKRDWATARVWLHREIRRDGQK